MPERKQERRDASTPNPQTEPAPRRPNVGNFSRNGRGALSQSAPDQMKKPQFCAIGTLFE
jgi:hypothetical protein